MEHFKHVKTQPWNMKKNWIKSLKVSRIIKQEIQSEWLMKCLKLVVSAPSSLDFYEWDQREHIHS